MPRPSSTPNHPARSPLAQLVADGFPPAHWRSLVTLPAEVMVAAIAALDRPRRTVPEGLAGLDAIAAGRSSDSDLVRAVVAAIFAEPEEERSPQPPEPTSQRDRVLQDCRAVVTILRDQADPADGAAYRHWVQQVAVRVCAASRPGAVPGRPPAPAQLTAAEREFLEQLGAVLA